MGSFSALKSVKVSQAFRSFSKLLFVFLPPLLSNNSIVCEINVSCDVFKSPFTRERERITFD